MAAKFSFVSPHIVSHLVKNPDMEAKFSFVSPHTVSHLVDNSNSALAKCLLQYVDKDHLLFVPFNVS